MAYTKTHAIKFTPQKAITYILNPEKTEGKLFVSTFGCSAETADIEFEFTRSQSKIEKGDVLARHFIQSFSCGETTPEVAHEIGQKFAEQLLKGKFEYVLTTHVDRGHIHNHLIVNSVSYIDKKKIRSNKDTYHNQVRKISDALCKEYGLSVIEPTDKGKNYKEILETRKGTSYKAKLKQNIDLAISVAKDFDDFLKIMQEQYNYEIKFGKYISFRADDQERFTRAKTLGIDYTEESINDRIKYKIYNSSGKFVSLRSESKKLGRILNLDEVDFDLIKWAKRNNFNEVIKLFNFIYENDIDCYDDIKDKFEKSSSDLKIIQNKITDKEKEISELNLILKNREIYAKSKPIYDKYKKSFFHNKFYEEHKSELILFESARKAFNESNSDYTFIKTKQLKLIMSDLYAEKNDLYDEYYKQKNLYKEVEIIKSNIDKVISSCDKTIEKSNTI